MGGDGSDGGGGWVVAVAVAACHQGGKRRTEPRQLYGDQKPGAARIERLRKAGPGSCQLVGSRSQRSIIGEAGSYVMQPGTGSIGKPEKQR